MYAWRERPSQDSAPPGSPEPVAGGRSRIRQPDPEPDSDPAPVPIWQSTSAPGGNRTPSPRLRRPMLYPIELRAQKGEIIPAPAVPVKDGCQAWCRAWLADSCSWPFRRLLGDVGQAQCLDELFLGRVRIPAHVHVLYPLQRALQNDRGGRARLRRKPPPTPTRTVSTPSAPRRTRGPVRSGPPAQGSRDGEGDSHPDGHPAPLRATPTPSLDGAGP